MNKNILLIIGAGKHQRSLIETARKRGFYTIAVDQNPLAFGFDYCDEAWNQSAYDYQEIYKNLKRNVDLSRMAGVMTQAARGCILSVAKISEKIGTRHLSVKTVKKTLSKAAMTKEFNKQALIGVYSHFDDVKEKIVFPCVIKVEGTSGGLGVHKITGEDELNGLLEKYGDMNTYIVEKYIEGRNFGIVGIKNKAKTKVYGIIEKFLNDDLTIDFTVFPAQIAGDLKKSLLTYMNSTLEKLGFDFGPFQLEVIVDQDNRIHFIECEPSVLGSYISEVMVPKAGSNNMIIDSINLVTEGTFESTEKPNEHVCMQKYYYATDNGNLESMEVIKKSKNVEFKPFLSVGDRIDDKRLYVANSMAVSNGFEEAKKYLDQFDIKIKVDSCN